MVQDNTNASVNQKSQKEKSDEKLRQTVITSTLVVLATSLALLAFDLLHSDMERAVIISMIVLMVGSLFFIYRQQLMPARLITPFATFIALTYFLLGENGIHDPAIVGYPIAVVLAGLLLGQKGAMIFGVLTTITLAGIAYSEANGIYVTKYSALLDNLDASVFWMLNLGGALIVYFLIKRLTEEAESAQENEQIQIQANEELTTLKHSLQKRVDTRTASLRRRNKELQASAEVARVALAITNVPALLSTVADLLSEQFGYYHTGVFIVDEKSYYATLEAASSEGGQKMLRRGYRIEIGSKNTVSATATERRSHISLDVGPDAVFFNDPDLPLTRSQMCVPLISKDQVLGVLDLHSELEQAFDQQSTEILQMLADQISLAITNLRLSDETRRTIDLLQAFSTEEAGNSWRAHLQKRSYGFTYTPLGLKSLADASQPENIIEGEQLAIPIKLRGKSIGKINLKRAKGKQWSGKEQVLIDEIALQVGLAVENARLVHDTQEQAKREQLVSEISARMRETLDVERVVQTAVREIRKSLSLHDISIQLEKPDGNTADKLLKATEL